MHPELFALAALSAATRFWRLFSPNAVVFDEMHFEHHAGHYLNGTFYVDVHPPLGKLLYAAEARLFGVSAATLLGGQPATVLRILPALCGALVVPLVYLILRQVGAARRVALLGGVAVLLDNALLADSRFILLEPLVIGFGLGAIALFLGARAQSGALRWWGLAGAALLAACALSVKWTGASALGVVLATLGIDVLRRRLAPRRAAAEAMLVVALSVAVYCAAFAVHFALLTRSGPDDAGLSTAFRETLIGNPAYRPGAHLSFFAKLADAHHIIAVGNRSLEGIVHPAASPWYTWPTMKHPIGLWQSDDRSVNIILLGNPVVWWGGVIAVLVALARAARARAAPRGFAFVFLAGGFLLNYLPFIAITRVMYLYHYLFALVWLSMWAAVCLGAQAGWSDTGDADATPLFRFSSRRSAAGYWTVVAAILIGFIYFAPLTYGWPLSPRAYDARFWVLHPQL